MTFLALVVIVLIAVALFVAAKAKSGADSEEGEWPFYAKKPLSTPEQALYFRLNKALPEHIVLAQVSLSRLLGVRKGNNYQAWANRINRMSVDFVVCTKDSSIVAVIELDDASHEREDRKALDTKKDRALSAAGVRVIRWHVRSLPDETAIKAAFSAQPSASSAAAGAARLILDGRPF